MSHDGDPSGSGFGGGEVWGVVLAAGTGSRFGGRKQFLMLGDRRLVDHAVSTTVSVSSGVVLVLPRGVEWEGPPVTTLAIGDATRIGSARSGLRKVPSSAGIILIHDAAHPLASKTLFASLIDAMREPGVDAAIPVIPATDTIMRARHGRVVDAIPRDGLVSVQTPQAFKAEVLRAAHRHGGQASDDSVLVQEYGATIKVVEGDPRNIHVTTATELRLAERLLGT
jgi:2-C-methyl-D-erythritol 4-phosphate cytidylyltransferase